MNCLFSENKCNTYDKSQRTSRQTITGCCSRPMRYRRCNFKRLSHKLAKSVVCSLSLSIVLFYFLSNVVYIVFVWLTDCNKGYVCRMFVMVWTVLRFKELIRIVGSKCCTLNEHNPPLRFT